MTRLALVLTLCSIAVSLVACGTSDRTDRLAALSQLSNGPGLPEECDVCWTEFQKCFVDNQGVEVCEDGIIACIDQCNAPPPPPDCNHCAIGYDACIGALNIDPSDPGQHANLEGATHCAAGFEGCLSACEGGEPPPVVCVDPDTGTIESECPEFDECWECQQRFDECVNAQWAGPNDSTGAPCFVDENGETQCPIDDPGIGEECEQIAKECEVTCYEPWPVPAPEPGPEPQPAPECEDGTDNCKP